MPPVETGVLATGRGAAPGADAGSGADDSGVAAPVLPLPPLDPDDESSVISSRSSTRSSRSGPPTATSSDDPDDDGADSLALS